MFKEYMYCDVCIATGGLTASELAFTRTPAILIVAAGHQDSRCTLFSKRGWANYIGTCENWHLEAKDLNFIPKPKTPFKHRLDEVIKIIMSHRIKSL